MPACCLKLCKAENSLGPSCDASVMLEIPYKQPFPHRWLAPGYRRPLIVQELLGYNADVICLQEVDESAFRVCLKPHLEAAGALCHACEPSGRCIASG